MDYFNVGDHVRIIGAATSSQLVGCIAVITNIIEKTESRFGVQEYEVFIRDMGYRVVTEYQLALFDDAESIAA